MMIKKILIGLVIAVVAATLIAAVVAGVFLTHYKRIVEAGIGQMLGVAAEIDDVTFDPKKRCLEIKNLRLHNPEGFNEEEVLAYVPRVTGEFAPGSFILGRKLHFKVLDIHVKVLAVIKHKDGRLNVEQLTIFKKGFDELPVTADRFVLTADYAIAKDFTKGNVPSIEVFEVKIKDAAYEGFPTVKDITAKVISEIVGRTTIKGATLVGVAVIAGAVGGWPIIIPAEAAVVLSGKDSYTTALKGSFDEVYRAGLDAAHELGKDISEDRKEGVISGHMNGADVTIRIKKGHGDESEITVSARRNFIPKVSLAGGVLYEIAQKLRIMQKKR